MNTKLEKITPTNAEEMLKLNTNNRRLRKKHIEFLAKEIIDGRWHPNGATIVFSEDRLLDGQHRLMAVIAAKKSIQSLVVRDLPTHVFETIDTGAIRRTTDVLDIRGEESAYLLAPTLSLIIRQKSGELLQNTRIASTKAMQFLESNGNVRESIRMCQGIKIMSVPAAAAGHFLFKKKDAALADALIEGLHNGFETKDSDPFWALRSRMAHFRRNREALQHHMQLAYMINAWNLKRKGQALKGELEGVDPHKKSGRDSSSFEII